MTSLKSLRRLILTVLLAASPIHAAEPESLDRTLEPYLKEFGLPAIAAAVFKGGAVIASGVAGTRRAGQNIPVGIEDHFHLGSDSKAFTSLLAGQFVEEGKLRWDSTLAEVFPELNHTMDAEFAKITLEELLSHSSGLTDGTDLIGLLHQSYMQDGNMDEVRYWMVKETAPKPLDHARGSKFDYCNLGYVIAGAVLERTGGKTWEELIDARIFEPLAPAPVLTHTGSNQMNLAIAMFWPETDFGFVLMTNVSGNPADDALGKLAANLYKSFSEKP